jgi:DNA-binding CsgD family transcriptional regulator
MRSGGDDGLRAFARRLGTANSCGAVAKLACIDIPLELGVELCVVSYFASTGRPVIVVDNVAELSDERRLAYVVGGQWGRDPLHRSMRERGLPVWASSADALLGPVHALLLPLVEPNGLVGSLRCGHVEPYTRELELVLAAAATLISVRLAHLGVTAGAATIAGVRLTDRQHEVARLAVHGYTNAEIGDELDISVNTVKVRLKETFERLHVRSRVELVRALGRAFVDDDLRVGITREGVLTTTCSEPPSRAVK